MLGVNSATKIAMMFGMFLAVSKANSRVKVFSLNRSAGWHHLLAYLLASPPREPRRSPCSRHGFLERRVSSEVP